MTAKDNNLSSNVPQHLLPSLSSTQSACLLENLKTQMTNRALTTALNNCFNWKLVTVSYDADFTGSLRCDKCHRSLKEQFSFIDVKTGNIQKLGITHFKQQLVLSEKSISQFVQVIDQEFGGTDEILAMYRNGMPVPKAVKAFIKLDESSWSKKIKQFVQLGLPISPVELIGSNPFQINLKELAFLNRFDIDARFNTSEVVHELVATIRKNPEQASCIRKKQQQAKLEQLVPYLDHFGGLFTKFKIQNIKGGDYLGYSELTKLEASYICYYLAEVIENKASFDNYDVSDWVVRHVIKLGGDYRDENVAILNSIERLESIVAQLLIRLEQLNIVQADLNKYVMIDQSKMRLES